MARRKDHTRPELKEIIRLEAEKLIKTKGFDQLTARALATHIGYSPGTIYNIYPDMAALKQDINLHTLGRLQATCLHALDQAAPGIPKLRALANAYLIFAQTEPRFWSLVFADPRHDAQRQKLSKPYRDRLTEMFRLIEETLRDHAKVIPDDAPQLARFLWASLHGITCLTLDGRLALVGTAESDELIDLLLQRFS